jgi:hypothetical protein
VSSYKSSHGPFRGVFRRDGTRFRFPCQYMSIAHQERQVEASAATAKRCEARARASAGASIIAQEHPAVGARCATGARPSRRSGR